MRGLCVLALDTDGGRKNAPPLRFSCFSRRPEATGSSACTLPSLHLLAWLPQWRHSALNNNAAPVAQARSAAAHPRPHRLLHADTCCGAPNAWQQGGCLRWPSTARSPRLRRPVGVAGPYASAVLHDLGIALTQLLLDHTGVNPAPLVSSVCGTLPPVGAVDRSPRGPSRP